MQSNRSSIGWQNWLSLVAVFSLLLMPVVADGPIQELDLSPVLAGAEWTDPRNGSNQARRPVTPPDNDAEQRHSRHSRLPTTSLVPHPSVEEQTLPRVTVVASSTDEIVLEASIPPVELRDVVENGVIYQRLCLPGTGTTGEIGKPELPTFGRFVAVPTGAKLRIEILEETPSITPLERQGKYRVYPTQQPKMDQAPKPPFQLDTGFYEQDLFYPPETVIADEVTTLRGINVTIVRFLPVQFNPALGRLRVFSRLRVRISFPGNLGQFVDQRLWSPYFENVYQRLLLNYSLLEAEVDQAGQEAVAPLATESTNGADYLIITHPDFLEQANTLADWKRRKGIDTEVHITTTTASAIRSYIQNAYENWNPAPSFALLVGDAEFIPTHYQTVHPSACDLGCPLCPYPANAMIGTDLPYADMTGNYYPELAIGRIPVDTTSEATTVVNKIINYERTPPLNINFYLNAMVAAEFQDYEDGGPDGFEDRRFVRTSEDIRDYLLTEGYTVDRVYYADPGVNPTNYNNGHFGNGEPLPAGLLRPGFAWDGWTADIQSAIHTGRFLVTHRDHGGSVNTDCSDDLEGWGAPRFTAADVPDLANGSMLPVVLSMNCETGWFDSETDHNTARSSESLAEAFLRQSDGGAVGVIGASRASYSGYNDWMAEGFVDAIWPDFLPYDDDHAAFSRPEYRMGLVLNYGKLAMEELESWTPLRQEEFELFHYFGDPTMEIWTAFPNALSVSHPAALDEGSTSLTVDVVQDDALVSLVQNGEIIATATSNGGQVTLNFNPVSNGLIRVTVTKHNHAPYEGSAAVTNGPYLSVSPSQLNFTVEQSQSDTQSFHVINAGGDVLTWQATEDPEEPWLSLYPASGTTDSGGSDPVDVIVDTSGLNSGDSKVGRIAVTWNGDPAYVDITVSVGGNQSPQLTWSDIDPPDGNTGDNTLFTYSVRYVDHDNDAPVTKQIVIDGESYTMSSDDTAYDSGVVFTLERTAQQLGAGNHTYHFFFTDGQGGSARLPASGEKVGPLVASGEPWMWVSEPDGIDDLVITTVDPDYTITWTATDPDSDPLEIDLYYSVIKDTGSLNPIDTNLPNTGSYTWDTSAVPEGSYYIYGVSDDGHGQSDFDWSAGLVTISHSDRPPSTVDWFDALQISASGLDSAIALGPSQAVHVVWVDGALYYANSQDGGLTWSTPRQLCTLDSILEPAVATDASGNVHVVWQANPEPTNPEIYYEKLDSQGNTLIDDMRLTNATKWSFTPDIVVDPNAYIHVVWSDTRNTSGDEREEIFYKRSIDGGSTWSGDTIVADNGGSECVLRVPTVAADASNVYVVYADNGTSRDWIYFVKGSASGTSWASPARIDQGGAGRGFAFNPRIVSNAAGLHVVFGKGSPRNVAYKRSTNGGNTWTDDRLITDGGDRYRPDIASSSDALYVASNSGDFLESLDNGVTWSQPDSVVGGSEPRIEANADGIHVTWWGSGIYCRRSAASFPPAIEITAPDSGGASADSSYTIEWIGNDPDSSGPLSIDLYYDVDQDPTSKNVIALGLENSGSYTWNTTAVPAGSYYIYGVIDDSTETASDYSDGTVAINHAPAIEVTEPDGVSDAAHAFYTVEWNGWDPDPDDTLTVTLYYDVDTDPAAKTFLHSDPDNLGSYLWETTALDEGTYYVYAEISDGVNPAVSDYSDGPVTVDHPNIPPTLAGLPNIVFDHSTGPTSTIDLWAYAWDAATPVDQLSYVISGTPPSGAGVTLPDNRTVHVEPSTDWCGYTDVTIRATDPEGLWDEDTFRVAVTWSCQGPLPVPSQAAAQDEPITLDLTPYEPQVGDGTGMVWYASGEDHCTVGGERSEDDVLTFTPEAGFVGSDSVTLHMVYPWGSEAAQELMLTWINTTTPPTLSGLPDQVFTQATSPTSTIDLWAYAQDPETPVDQLTYTISSTPPSGAGVTLPDNRTVCVEPSSEWCGHTDVTIRVTDPEGLWDEDTFRVAVTWSCQDPLAVPDQVAPQGEPIILDLTPYEPQIGDGTGMYWHVTGEDHCTVSGEYSEDDVLTFTPDPGFVGSDMVRLHMSYPWGSEATQELMLTWERAGPVPLAQRVTFTKEASDASPHVGETLAFTLSFNTVPTQTQALQVRVTDSNPAPNYLEIISDSITGGATYSPTIDAVVWEDTLFPAGTQPQVIAFQVRATGIPSSALAAGYPVTNTAVLIDLNAPGTLLKVTAEAGIRILPTWAFLPVVAKDYGG